MVPEILALDFDGVCCDGLHEYFETSRRTHARVWPAEPMPGRWMWYAAGGFVIAWRTTARSVQPAVEITAEAQRTQRNAVKI